MVDTFKPIEEHALQSWVFYRGQHALLDFDRFHQHRNHGPEMLSWILHHFIPDPEEAHAASLMMEDVSWHAMFHTQSVTPQMRFFVETARNEEASFEYFDWDQFDSFLEYSGVNRVSIAAAKAFMRMNHYWDPQEFEYTYKGTYSENAYARLDEIRLEKAELIFRSGCTPEELTDHVHFEKRWVFELL